MEREGRGVKEEGRGGEDNTARDRATMNHVGGRRERSVGSKGIGEGGQDTSSTGEKVRAS